MSNAMKFTPKDGSVFVKMTRASRGSEARTSPTASNMVHPGAIVEEVMRVQVRDTGAGISQVNGLISYNKDD